MSVNVFAYGYHTTMVWAFSRDAVEADRRDLIADWSFDHSPAEAVTFIAEVPLADVEADWHYVG